MKSKLKGCHLGNVGEIEEPQMVLDVLAEQDFQELKESVRKAGGGALCTRRLF